MQRVLVIGCCGAGKSTFSRLLAERDGLPCIPLDRHFWRPGWVETPLAEWTAMQADLTAGATWVIDGSYHRTLHLRLPRCDTVIWLDLARWRCMLRILWRVASTYGRVRPDLGPGCPEQFDWNFLRYSWNYQRLAGAHIAATLSSMRPDQRLVILRSPREVRNFLAQPGVKR